MPCVKAQDTVFLTGVILSSSLVQILFGCLAWIFIYRLIVSIKRRKSCHQSRSIGSQEQTRYHLDLIIPYLESPVSIKIRNVGYSKEFYKPITDPCEIQIVKTIGKTVITLTNKPIIETLWVVTIEFPSSITTKHSFPAYSGVGYLKNENN
jgi:hypothetical protein